MVHFRAHWPVLIVVPSSLLKQWPDEIQKYAGDIVKPSDVCVVGKSTDIKTGLITIITYKVMDNLVANKQLSPDLFGVVVADESHNLKNKDTSRSGAVLPFLKRASVAICMTGTPAVNRPVELFSQLNGILPEVFSDYNQFVHRYCDAKPHRTLPGLNVSGSSNEAELNMLLNAVVMIRRTKADVLSSLPEKRRELRYVDPDPECLPEIRRINARSKKLDEQIANPAGRDNAEIQAMNNEKQQLLTALYTVTGTSKIPAIREELVKMIEESRKERGDSATARAAEDCTADSDSNSTVVLKGGPVVTAVDSDCEPPPNAKATAKKDQTKAAPIIMDLEDDIVTGGVTAVTSSKQRAYVMDLCDSNAEDRGAATANRKRPRGATGGGKLGGWDADSIEDDDHDDDGGRAICGDSDSEGEDCDFNLRDIKAGLNRQRSKGTTKAATGDSSGTGGRVFSLFEQVGAGRKRKTAGVKGKAAPKAKAADGNVSHSNSSSDLVQTAAKSVGQKIIVFFHHKTVLSAIEDSLVQMQVKFIKIDGATPQAKRAKMIDQFQNDDVVCPHNTQRQYRDVIRGTLLCFRATDGCRAAIDYCVRGGAEPDQS
jgi:SNF2 family DNA or RNA helicase